jgi:hypothetical protein
METGTKNAGTGQARGCLRPSIRRGEWWLVGLAMPLLRVTRLLAQEENQVGYRHEFYKEDDHRIEVSTDSALFDVGISSHFRVSGEFVADSISGATPTGAPPQSQWPFPSYNALYQNAYNQAYTSFYTQYVSENQIYVDAGYITYDQMTNSAAQYAAGAAPPVATNSANASYTSLTNNPNYSSTTVPLTQMHDHRNAFSIGVPMSFDRHALTPSFAYSEESDYISYGGSLNYSLALHDKNTTLNLGWALNCDNVRDDKFVWQPKLTDNFMIGFVQLLSRKSYVTVNFTGGYEDGYLSDPYRGIMAENFPQNNPDDAALIPEQRPTHRVREVMYLSWLQFVDPLQGSVQAGYRYFHDSWSINAHTFDVTWNQKVGPHVVISPFFRYYLQSAADFYYVILPDYNNLPSAYSSDYRLSHFDSFACGVNLTWRVQQHLSLDAGYMRYAMQGLDNVTSQSAYPSANVFTLGLRVWF